MSTRVLNARYRLGALLGRGGMAEVFDGYDQRLDRPVAVKLLRPEMAADSDIRDRFEVEARSAARLSHPNVVAVFDTGEDDGTPFIVMERLPGDTMADRMAAGPVDEAWLRRVASDVLGALGAAHGAGLVHRDVKPGNILIGEDGCAKVADFGIAKSLEVAADVTGTGLLVGTPAYVAPERLDGRPATERSDLYSLGVVLYEALVGAKPFVGTTPVAMASAVLNDVPRPLSEARPDVDPAFAAAVERAMARDPDARPASARELARLIAGTPAGAADATVPMAVGGIDADATLVGAPAPVPVPPAPSGPGAPVRPSRAGRAVGRSLDTRRRARVAVLIGAALLGILLLAGLVSDGGSGGKPGSSALVAALRDLAGRVEEGDGPMGPEAGRRLEDVADGVEAGGGADDATALIRDAAEWRREGRLSAAAATEITALLGRIDGVDASAATTTTQATTTTTTVPTTTAPAGEGEGDGDGDGDEGGKKKGKGGDD